GTAPYSSIVYQKASENMANMIRKGILRQDKTANLYVYQIENGSHIQTGVVGAASLDAYDNNMIKKHELTRPDKEDDRVRQILAVNAHTGPIFAVHEQDRELVNILAELSAEDPVYSILSFDKAIHRLWVVEETQIIRKIVRCFERLGKLYIADGHHRSAAASRVAKEHKKRNKGHTGLEPYNTFLLVSFPSNQVQILDYNRVVRGLNGLSPSQLIDKIKMSFEVKNSEAQTRPVSPGSFGMYLDGKWYTLFWKNKQLSAGFSVADLDVSILTDNILSLILRTGNPRTDPRIEFVGGVRGLEELKTRVDTIGDSVAFSLYPTSVNHLMAVADASEILPPKTTWFEPKLADGLVSLLLA
ncbi:MAG: DUF1015 family protein, partial [Pseudomonadota bacterium]|nr:DUF1015 family protein [Pseudomonadota bacterium]